MVTPRYAFSKICHRHAGVVDAGRKRIKNEVVATLSSPQPGENEVLKLGDEAILLAVVAIQPIRSELT